MSKGMNRVMLLGNLGADPELRATAGGHSVLRLRLATTESFLDRDRQVVERTEWHSVSVFGARAEGLARILSKGDSIFVEGTIRHSSYEKEGVTRYRTDIIAREIVLNGRRRAPAQAPAIEPANDAAEDQPYAGEVAMSEADPMAATDQTTVTITEPIADVVLETNVKKRARRENGAAHLGDVTA